MAFPDKPTAHLLGSHGPIHAVAYSASPGTYILTGSGDRAIRLYNPTTTAATAATRTRLGQALEPPAVPQAALIQTYVGHGYEVLSIDVAPDNERFVSSGGDRAVLLWDVATATVTRRFGGPHGHASRVNCVRFGYATDSDGGNNNNNNSISSSNSSSSSQAASPAVVVSAGFDTSVRIWDARSTSSRPVQVLDDARDAVTSVVVRGAAIVAASVDGRVRAYDVRAGRCTTDILPASATSLTLSRDGRALLVGCLDSRLRLLDRDSGACLRAYAHPAWRNTDLRLQSLLGAHERYVVVGDELSAAGPNDPGPQHHTQPGDAAADLAPGDGRIWAWDLLSGELAARVRVPWGPDGTESRRRVVGKDGKEKTRTNVISCIAWRDDGWGNQFCVGGTSGVVTVFDASP